VDMQSFNVATLYPPHTSLYRNQQSWFNPTYCAHMSRTQLQLVLGGAQQTREEQW